MQHTAMLEAVRELVRSAFAQQGAALGAAFSEHVLIREDHYCGRSFHSQGVNAIWFIEEDQIKIYGRDGTVVDVFCASQAVNSGAEDQRRAA